MSCQKNSNLKLIIAYLLAILLFLSSCAKKVEPVIAPESETRPAQLTTISFYDESFNGRKTASGEIFSAEALTAAHRNLAFGTKVELTNPKNGAKVQVRINDRGPHVKGREFDLTSAAMRQLGITRKGIARVQVKVLP